MKRLDSPIFGMNSNYNGTKPTTLGSQQDNSNTLRRNPSKKADSDLRAALNSSFEGFGNQKSNPNSGDYLPMFGSKNQTNSKRSKKSK